MPEIGRLLTAMITPFHEDGSVNYEAAQQLARQLVEDGSDGLVVCGTTGEAATLDSTIAAGLEVKVRTQWAYARTRFFRHRLAVASLLTLIFIFGVGIFANYVAPYSYSAFDLTNLLQAPTTVGHHFFGTDEIGRDYFSGCIYGIRTSLEVGVFVAFLSSVIGLIIGAIAGEAFSANILPALVRSDA